MHSRGFPFRNLSFRLATWHSCQMVLLVLVNLVSASPSLKLDLLCMAEFIARRLRRFIRRMPTSSSIFCICHAWVSIRVWFPPFATFWLGGKSDTYHHSRASLDIFGWGWDEIVANPKILSFYLSINVIFITLSFVSLDFCPIFVSKIVKHSVQ